MTWRIKDLKNLNDRTFCAIVVAPVLVTNGWSESDFMYLYLLVLVRKYPYILAYFVQNWSRPCVMYTINKNFLGIVGTDY